MEYKLFGADQQPADDLKGNLMAFCQLSEDQRTAIIEWFLSADVYDVYGSQLPPQIAASSLLPEQFRQSAGTIRSVLSTWQARNLQLQDVERDLLLLGCNTTQVSTLSNALGLLSEIKEKVWIDTRKDAERWSGLPTIDDVNILWNARPVFGADAMCFYDSERFEDTYQRLLGLLYLATIEVICSDSAGNKQRTAFQLDERTFQCLENGMKRARHQLDVLKRSTQKAVQSPSEAKGEN